MALLPTMESVLRKRNIATPRGSKSRVLSSLGVIIGMSHRTRFAGINLHESLNAFDALRSWVFNAHARGLIRQNALSPQLGSNEPPDIGARRPMSHARVCYQPRAVLGL